MPAHHKLEACIDEYLVAAGIREDGKTPLFRSAVGKTGVLTEKPMNRIDAYRMIRRRTAGAGFKVKLGCHVFRATGIAVYMLNGGLLEYAQRMAAHRVLGQFLSEQALGVMRPAFGAVPATNLKCARATACPRKPITPAVSTIKGNGTPTKKMPMKAAASTSIAPALERAAADAVHRLEHDREHRRFQAEEERGYGRHTAESGIDVA
jgi:hypothetical protein